MKSIIEISCFGVTYLPSIYINGFEKYFDLRLVVMLLKTSRDYYYMRTWYLGSSEPQFPRMSIYVCFQNKLFFVSFEIVSVFFYQHHNGLDLRCPPPGSFPAGGGA